MEKELALSERAQETEVEAMQSVTFDTVDTLIADAKSRAVEINATASKPQSGTNGGTGQGSEPDGGITPWPSGSKKKRKTKDEKEM